MRTEIARALVDVRAGMHDMIHQPYGGGYIMHDLPLDVAGKTGTAQIQDNQKTNAFFVGFAPYDNPQIAILILVENSKEGSLNTLPVAKDVFLWYYKNRIGASR